MDGPYNEANIVRLATNLDEVITRGVADDVMAGSAREILTVEGFRKIRHCYEL